jgi:hypothetical protein
VLQIFKKLHSLDSHKYEIKDYENTAIFPYT